MFEQTNFGSPSPSYQPSAFGFGASATWNQGWQTGGSPQQQILQLCERMQQAEQRHAQLLHQIELEERQAASQLQQCIQLTRQLSYQQNPSTSWQTPQFQSFASPSALLPQA